MRLYQLLEVTRIEYSGRREPGAEDGIAQSLPQRPAEPARQRNREALLGPVQDLARQIRLHRLLQQVLALLTADLQCGRQGRQPFHQRMIHQRLADLERMGHAGSIDLGVDVADQIGFEIQYWTSASGSSVCARAA